MEQRPSVGRVVHYTMPQGAGYVSPPNAAIVTAVRQDMGQESPGYPGDGTAVDLAVFSTDGVFFSRGVWFSETPEPGHWNWPPRV